jgi:6-phosphogluconolactonase
MRTLPLPALPAEAWILPDGAALSRAAADEIARLLSHAVHQRGHATVALAGGSTPKATYAELAAGQRQGTRPVPWEQVHVFLGDERMVPLDHPDSNHRMAQESLLRHVPVAADHVHPVPTHLEPAAAARAYEDTLRRTCGTDSGVPRLDLVLLGMGTDGHTASLFPGTTALEERTAWVASNWVPRLQAHRVTLTFPVLAQAGTVLFLVTGADKARVVREALQPRAGDPRHPAGQVRPVAGRLLWLLDEAAAAELAAG